MKGTMSDRRFGEIEISSSCFENCTLAILSELFKIFFTLKCEYNFARAGFIYEGYCKDFEIVGEVDFPNKYYAVYNLKTKKVSFQMRDITISAERTEDEYFFSDLIFPKIVKK